MESEAFGFVLGCSSVANNIPFHSDIKERQFLEVCTASQRDKTIRKRKRELVYIIVFGKD
jgi:hypothetical protein